MFWIIGKIGTPELAAANVLVTVLLFAILAGLGLGLGCATLVGQALGKREPDDARRVMFVSIGTQWLLFLPLAFVIGPLLGYGLLGVWLWQGVTRAIQSTLFFIMWKSRKWQHIEV